MSAAHISITPFSRASMLLLRYPYPRSTLLPPPDARRSNATGRNRRLSTHLRRVAESGADVGEGEPLDRKTERFNQIQEVPREERDRIQRQQLIDRAAAAIAAARALLSERPPQPLDSIESGSDGPDLPKKDANGDASTVTNGVASEADAPKQEAPGPDFWSWAPPQDETPVEREVQQEQEQQVITLKPLQQSVSHTYPSNYLLLEKDPPVDFLPIPFQSSVLDSAVPPLQSTAIDLDARFSMHAAEAVEALSSDTTGENPPVSRGVSENGSKWWKETGMEERPNGVICRWTLTRGVSSYGELEWEEKYWEASDRFDYKELGSEKSGRDAGGNVWREYWKECMWQDLASGLTHIEKAADKWGKNGKGEEWQEKWWEHYDASGKADKWAHKWCSRDPSTPLDPGHAHVWHERWGEKYDGRGGTTKYTDKWAERAKPNGEWSKWGDKWDEIFTSDGRGMKQGETWWEGPGGERWNRTWGEQHGGTGWVHKFGTSSDGEHWDTHVEEETWYEKYPHYGFDRCYENSVQLRAVRRRLGQGSFA